MDSTARLVAESLRPLPDLAAGLVVAVSGGADSVALLRAVLAGRERTGIGPVVLAHLNHQLRGAESDGDEAFVEELHARLAREFAGLSLSRQRLDVAAAARDAGENLESAARRLRYHWLAEVGRERGCRWVATGHTADDQAETVLQRLLRGTGLQGLRGIAPQRDLELGVGVVRPLLQARRGEIEAFLNGLGQAYRHDASNDERRFMRNRIRHDLLPLLAREYNPGIVEIMNRLACQADEFFRSEEAAAAELLQRAERPRAGEMLVFDRATLAAAPRGLVRAALRRVWQRENYSMDSMNFEAWERLADVAVGDLPAADLGAGIRVVNRQGVVQVVRQKAEGRRQKEEGKAGDKP